MKPTDKLPWAVSAIFFAGILLWLLYGLTRSPWVFVVGGALATLAGEYLRRVFTRK